MVRRAVLLVLALLAAGCVAPGADDVAPAEDGAWTLPFPDPMAHGDGHDHHDVTAHAFSWNVQQTDHHPLKGSTMSSSGAHALDVKNGYLFAAVYGGDADAEGGFFIFDVSVPEKPKQVGRYQFPGSLGGDRSIHATEDADFVVLGTEAVTCAGHVNPMAPGMYLIDVRDKSRPVPVSYVPATGVHSVTVHRIDGEDYVFAVTAGENIFHIQKGGVTPQLVRVGSVSIGHDSVVMDDPEMNIPILYAARGGAGFEIYDLSDPARPTPLAAWDIPDRGDRYYLHTGAVRFIDDKRIVVVTTEDWEDYPSMLYVLDATDFGHIEVLGSWHNPGSHGADGLRFSMHNPRFHGDVLILAHYHGGMWALDLSTPEYRANPKVVGFFSPGESNGWTPQRPATAPVSDSLCGVFHLGEAPIVFDIESGDGVVYVADMPTGLYTIKPTW